MALSRGRRTGVAAGTVGLALLLAPVSAVAQDDPPPAPVPAPAEVRCVVTDPRLSQLSGMSARRGTLYAVSDQGPVVYELDEQCEVTRSVTLKQPVVDLEDLGQSVDGLLWLADVGGNREPRTEVAVIRYNPETGNVVRFRMAYPDGPHDAEAVLVTPSAQVLLVTKDETGVSGVYTVENPLQVDRVNRMTRVAEVSLREIPGRTRGNGSVLVTGGAVSYDGTRFVLRTYKDAYEWDAPDTDIVAALVNGRPRVVPLPETPQGEAVTYDEGGAALLVGGEQLPAPVHRVSLTRPETVPAAATGVGDEQSGAVSRTGLALVALSAVAVVVWQLVRALRPRARRPIVDTPRSAA